MINENRTRDISYLYGRPSIKKNNDAFLIAQYENWSKAIDRIKQDEQRWISTLLILFGAILTFLVSDMNITSSAIPKENLVLASLSFFIIYGIALVWGIHSLTLRLQYYNVILKLDKIKYQFDSNKSDFLNDDIKFKKWRIDKTQPNKSKLTDFWLLGGLVLISGWISLYRFVYPFVFSHHQHIYYCHNFNSNYQFIFWLLAGLYFFGLFFFPLVFYPHLDKKNFKRFYDDIINEKI